MAEAIQKIPRVDRLLRAADTAMRLKKPELALWLALRAYDDKCRFGAFEDAGEIMKKFPLLEGIMKTYEEEIRPVIAAIKKGTLIYAVQDAIAAAKN
ncbi:hypothetical protein COV61_02365 [Candidatus Micrarchaeota archaeon CG11_big_fil_rev_8_21_14_0_20_47_5]|nr:MAG: hypothetical protein AUJ17_01025 [Candidatus Micrarchaeota archaeon CG1_02_47_40]PIN83704.1 MAG: hypothetical protein COV61_02365 [Candidatus Micrarchaeota archaeon CG11_big_fil_rev_8_21_14_0_20_47_5]